MKRARRRFTPDQKAEAVRRHLRDKVPVSDLADELKIQPSQIHQWVNIVLLEAEQAFSRTERSAKREESRREASKDARIERLEEKLNLKNEVIAELMEENVKAKKELGEL